MTGPRAAAGWPRALLLVLLCAAAGSWTEAFAQTTPTVTLVLSPSSISESGGVASVTATLSGTTSEAVTVTVAATAGTGAVATDFTLSSANTLTIAAGATASTGTVTVTANDNSLASSDKSVTVSGTVTTSGSGVAAPSAVTLTLVDDDTPPTVTLALSPSSVSENGGESTVTAALSRAWNTALTVTVGAAAGTGAAEEDFTLSAANTLTIAAGDTASTGTVTVTANDNSLASSNKPVTVSGTVMTGGSGVAAPSAVTLTLVDDDPALVLTLLRNSFPIPNPLAVGESFTFPYYLRLKTRPTENVTVAVTYLGSPEIRVGRTSFTFTPDNWNSAQSDFMWNVRDADSTRDIAVITYTAAGGNYEGVSAEVQVIVQEAGADSAGLLVSPQTTAQSRLRVTEAGGQATFLVNLRTNSSAAVTVSVSSLDPSEGTVSPSSLVFQPSTTPATQRVTVTGVDDATFDRDVDWAVRLDPSSGDATYNALSDVDVLVTTIDDEVSDMTLALSPSSISENGGESTVTAVLSRTRATAVTVTVAAAAGAGAVPADFTLSAANTLTIAAGATASTGTVTVTAIDNYQDSPNKSVTVSGTVTGGNGVANPSDVTLTLVDDDPPPAMVLAFPNGNVIPQPLVFDENRNVRYTVRLGTRPTENVTVTVTHAGSPDIRVNRTSFTFTPDNWNSAQSDRMNIAADADSRRDVAVITYTAAGGNYEGASTDFQVVTRESGGDSAGLLVSPQTTAQSRLRVTEAGGQATFLVNLRTNSSAAVTVSVSSLDPTEGTVSPSSLVFQPNVTNLTRRVTVTGADDADDDGSVDWAVRLDPSSGDGAYNGLANVDVLVRTIDDDGVSEVTLSLSPSSVSESGGVSSVTATLSDATSVALTVTVGAAAGTGAAAEDFTLSEANTLTFAAGDTESTGAVTVTANGNAVDSPDKQVTVTGTVTGGNGVAAPSDVTLTLADDEELPTVTLALSPSSILESGGESTVTATLSGASSEAVTVTVGAAPGAGAVATDFTLSTADTLTIAAGSTTSTGAVTVTANDNAVQAPDKQVTVSGTVTGGNGVADPSALTLTLVDDETLPTVTLALSPSSISESGDESTVTAALSRTWNTALTVTVGAAAGTGAAAEDFTLSEANTLTIAAGSTTSTGAVTVTANDNAVDSPDKSVTVTGTVAGGNGVANPLAVTLTLADDEALPTVTLSLSSLSVSESGGESTVTATLSGASSEALTVTVGAAAGTGAVAADFTLSPANTLTIAAGDTASTGDVTVTANDNAVQAPDKQVTVSGTVTGGNGVADPSALTLTLVDDETPPTATLALSPSSISENGGESTVTAALSKTWDTAVTVTVGAATGTGAVAADFTLSPANTLTIAVGDTTSTGTVTVTANDNYQDSPNKSVTVSGMVTGGNGVADPSDVTLTLVDDDAPAALVLALPNGASFPQPVVIGENIPFLYAVRLGTRPTENVTVTVTHAGSPDIRVDRTSFTFTPANWNIGQSVRMRIAADADSRRDVAVITYTAAGGNYEGVSTDLQVISRESGGDSAGLLVSPQTTAQSRLRVTEPGGKATFLVNLRTNSSEAVTVSVSSLDPSEGTVDPSSLVFQPFTTPATQRVTVTGADDTNDDGSVDWAVRLDPSSGDGAYNGLANVDVLVTTIDDDGVSEVTLSLSPSSISESGGVSSVTATLSEATSEALTVTVGAAAGTGAAAEDFTLSPANTLTIAVGDTTSTGAVTVTANGNDVDSPDKQVTVTGTVTGGNGAAAPSAVTLTLEDDDEAGLVVSPETSTSSRLRTGEDGAQATFTVALATEPTGDVVLDVASSDTGEGTVDTDPDTNGAQDTLTFTTTTWNSAQTVTVTGVDDAAADGPRDYTVTLEVDQANTADANYDALSTVTVYLVNDDDDATPDVNGDGDVDYQDALLMYYTYTAPILGDAEFGPGLRRILFRNLRGGRTDDAAGYLAILTAADDWKATAAGDLNLDGDVDYQDALLMYYTYTAPILGDSEFGPGLRSILFRNLRGSRDDAAAGYLALLDAAKALVTAHGSGP